MRSWTLGLRKSAPSIRSSTIVERAQVLVDVDLWILQPQRGSHLPVQSSEVEQRVPEAAHTFVELEHGATRRGAPLA